MLTFVQVSLLVAGIAAFLWAVPYEDCGLLDEFFEVVQTNSSTVIELADLQLTSQYFLRLLERRLFQPGGGVNLELLQFLPADLGGGETGVAAARKAPNRSPIVSIIIITILVFMCLCCLVVAGSDMISSYGSSRSSLLDQLNNGAILNLLQSPGAHRGMRICHLLLTVLSGVFLFGLLVSICVYLYGGALPASTLASSSPAGTTSASVEASTKQLSILSAVQYTKDKIITFLKVGTSTGVALTEQFVAQLDGNLNLSLASGVHEAMNALLKEYNIRSLLDTGKQLQVDVQILDGNMLFIRKTNQDTIGQVSRLQGALKVIYDLITSELGTLCQRGLGSNLDAQCAKLQANSQVLIINLDPSAINTDPPAVLNFVLNEFGINLQEILNMFGEATKKLEATERDILQKVLQFVDVQSVLSPLISFWQQLDVQVDRTNTSAQATVNYIENGVTLAKPFLLLTIYLPVVIFIVLLATAIILFVLFLFEALEGNLFLAEPPANHQGSPILPDLAMSSKVCSNCGFTAYAVIMILIMFLMGGLLLILPLTMLLASGGCTYLESTSGVAKTDYLLNNYMQKAWPQIVARIINSSSANDKLTEFLLLEPPRGLIKAMTMSCWNSTKMETMKGANVGLLNLIGWQTIIDVPKVIQSDLVNGTIQKGEQPDLLPAATLSAFANELETFGKAVQDLGLSSAEILLRAAQLINVEIPKVQGAAVNVSQLRAAFENVQNRRNLTTSINNLVVGLDDTLKIVSNEATLLAPVPGIYQNLVKQFLTQMQIDLSDQVFQLTRRLLPCVELYQATSSSLAATCHQEGLLSRIYAWTLSLALCLLFTLLFFFNVFILSIVQSQQFSRLGIRNNPLEERARQLSVSERYVQGPGFSSALPTTPQLVPHLPTDAIGVPQGVVFGRTFQPY
ncbi:unnamed protein product [Schistocephalus solidus]|uniref:PRM1A n=1 Tax=Schistocephalus solidus TaxID=70667 RepID=A0A183S724_SCHSO|nr:unnamed protein product [Schistocephalus solidus]